MDPYLEHPRSWPNFHHRLITAIAISLAPQLRPKYRVVVEEAIYPTEGQDSVLVGVPDVAVQAINQPSAASLPVETSCGVYDQSGYNLVIDYGEDPLPPLSEGDATWLATWLKQKGLR